MSGNETKRGIIANDTRGSVYFPLYVEDQEWFYHQFHRLGEGVGVNWDALGQAYPNFMQQITAMMELAADKLGVED